MFKLRLHTLQLVWADLVSGASWRLRVLSFSILPVKINSYDQTHSSSFINSCERKPGRRALALCSISNTPKYPNIDRSVKITSTHYTNWSIHVVVLVVINIFDRLWHKRDSLLGWCCKINVSNFKMKMTKDSLRKRIISEFMMFPCDSSGFTSGTKCTEGRLQE